MQTNALAVIGVAGGTREIHDAAAAIEQRFADRRHFLLFGMRERNGDLHAVRFVRNVGDKVFHVGRFART